MNEFYWNKSMQLWFILALTRRKIKLERDLDKQVRNSVTTGPTTSIRFYVTSSKGVFILHVGMLVVFGLYRTVAFMLSSICTSTCWFLTFPKTCTPDLLSQRKQADTPVSYRFQKTTLEMYKSSCSSAPQNRSCTSPSTFWDPELWVTKVDLRSIPYTMNGCPNSAYFLFNFLAHDSPF